MTTFFTSDLHIGHKLVSGIRGFGWPKTARLREWDYVEIGLHDATIANNWDSVIGEDDEVWILGDLSINSGPHVAEWIEKRPGRKHLVSGNHDKSHTALFPKYAEAKVAEWAPYFESIQDEATLEIGGKIVTLSHFPYWSWGDGPDTRGDREPGFRPRYPKVRPPEGKKTILLHGHTHGLERAHERSLHIGLDAWGLQLVPMSTVEGFLEMLGD